MATLHSTVVLNWTNARGYDRDCTVEATYRFDGGDDLEVVSVNVIGSTDIGDWEFDELLNEALIDVAPEAYGDWLADQDDYAQEAA